MIQFYVYIFVFLDLYIVLCLIKFDDSLSYHDGLPFTSLNQNMNVRKIPIMYLDRFLIFCGMKMRIASMCFTKVNILRRLCSL